MIIIQGIEETKQKQQSKQTFLQGRGKRNSCLNDIVDIDEKSSGDWSPNHANVLNTTQLYP